MVIITIIYLVSIFYLVYVEELQRRGYHNAVRRLIETMYHENCSRKVDIAAHSMGAPLMLHSLTQVELLCRCGRISTLETSFR